VKAFIDRGSVKYVPIGRGEVIMFYWAAVFLVIGLVALLFGFGGIAGMSMNIAWILFVIGIVLAIIFMVLGRRPRV